MFQREFLQTPDVVRRISNTLPTRLRITKRSISGFRKIVKVSIRLGIVSLRNKNTIKCETAVTVYF